MTISFLCSISCFRNVPPLAAGQQCIYLKAAVYKLLKSYFKICP